jgi:hydroxypyruvate isomerase
VIRRNFIKNTAIAGAALGLGNSIQAAPALSSSSLKGNVNHSVARWSYGYLSLDELCKEVKRIGFSAIDLIGPKEWDILKNHDVDSSMCNGAEINLTDGWNDKTYHEQLIKNYSELIPLVAKAGYKNLICFSGNRRNIRDEEGLANCVIGLKKVLGLAEKHGVILQMELFNTKVDHPGYMCDNTPWAVALCEALGSENFKLLYDIYHMQINEGNLIQTIRENHQYFGHYHTAGVPGRHEINNSQEINYPAVIKAIVETGYKGYVAQEFIPTAENKIASLEEAILICDV